jgi:biopolymer transport protein ExbD
MARERKKQESNAGELNLTAMIDVAFQLLNFFVITTKPVDVFANLDVFRPSAEKTINAPPPSVELLEIMIGKNSLFLQKKVVALAEIDRQLTKLASFNKDVPVIIKCTDDSSHASLVSILDLCAKSGLSKISVFSM